MTKLINMGHVDTPVTNPVALTMTREPINYDADFRKLKETSDELWLTNITSPIDRPEKIRIARKEVGDVYLGTDISTSVQAPSKKGVNLHIQLQQIAEITDSENPEFLVQAPVTVSLTIKTPASYISADDAMNSVERLLSGVFETNDKSTSRLAALLRGSLAPSDL